MLEMKIPKEVRSRNIKIIGPLSIRQLVSIIIFGPLGLLGYNIAKNFVNSDVALSVVVLFAVPCGLVGWIKVQGMHFEKYAKAVIKSTLLTSSKRKYKITNSYVLEKKDNDKKNKQKKKYKASKASFK